MNEIRLAAAQFEHRDADKEYNLGRVATLTQAAAARGAQAISFHECCLTGYTFLQTLSKEELLELAEPVPEGPSVRHLIDIAAKHQIAVLAGLLEEDQGEVYNTFVCVTQDGLIAKHRKIHAFVNPHLASGDSYTVFELFGCQCGILICYDINVIENVRATTLAGAEILFAPHVTGCLPSPQPGRGLVNPELWHNRERDPVRLRLELNGPKGRDWLMKWLPARAYDNGLFVVFSNPIGMDDDQVRNGNSMILDPFGEILSECHELGDDICIAQCDPQCLELSSGRRFLRARRPDLYSNLLDPPTEPPITKPTWKLKFDD